MLSICENSWLILKWGLYKLLDNTLSIKERQQLKLFNLTSKYKMWHGKEVPTLLSKVRLGILMAFFPEKEDS